MNKDFEERIRDIFSKYSIGQLLDDILASGETLLIGGVLREYKENKLEELPRDFDIVVNSTQDKLIKSISPYNPHRNRFGGYKISYNNLIIDVWCLQDTWAYKKKLVKCRLNEYSLRLQDTVFLNIDSIVYNLTQDIWYDERYQEAMRTKVLDVVLKENPQIPLNIVRSIIYSKKYSMQISVNLRDIILKYISNTPNFLQQLLEIQIAHYNSIVLNESVLEHEINRISM